MRRGLPDAAATGRRVGQPGQMGLGTQRGGQRVHTPAYRGPRSPLPPQRAWYPRAQPHPDLQGSPGPRRPRGLLLPSQGHLDPNPAIRAVAPHRLPAEHKGSHPQTLLTGGAMTPRSHRARFPPRQQERLSAARQQGGTAKGRDPNPTSLSTTPLKGRAEGTHLSTGVSQNSSS